LENRIPEKYIPQVQHQLLATGLEGMYYFSFDGSDGKIVEVARDEKYIEEMFLQEKDFWDSVLNKEEPDLTDKDYLCMDDNADWTGIVDLWKEVNASIKTLEQKEETLRATLIALAGSNSARGSSLKLTKSLTKGAVDYTKIPELKGVNLDQFRKSSYHKWRISVT
jgi:hypothetical protein